MEVLASNTKAFTVGGKYLDSSIPFVSGITTYTSGGTFKLEKNCTKLTYLIVAGAGGGGSAGSLPSGGKATRANGGGGGAGGVLYGEINFPTAGDYECIVGAGGASATNGSNSVITELSLTAIGGGYGGTSKGGSGQSIPPAIGGSGGGGEATLGLWYTPPTHVGAVGTAGQGNAGSDGYWAPPSPYVGGSGGGGGATAAGFHQSGGTGHTSDISGTLLTYGVGGAGRYGISESSSSSGTAGAANTGNGGEGAYWYNSSVHGSIVGAAGGSGIIILKYS